MVSQEPVLFATTVAENIRYGKDGATQEDIEKVAKMANAHGFVKAFPEVCGLIYIKKLKYRLYFFFSTCMHVYALVFEMVKIS